MSKEAQPTVGRQEYSEATRRVFERTLALVQKQLTGTQTQALRELLEKNQFHDANELLKALRLSNADHAD
jgi:hypothetical protein